MVYAERLAAVRRAMAEQQVDAFFLQRTDQYNSEYLPPAEERVAWLTGFTGSNASVAITASEAAVFTDGRYTVQLAEQVDATLFERLHIVKQPAAKWLEARLAAGELLGLDPYLTKQRELTLYQGIAESAGAQVTLLAANPLDLVWDAAGRPAAPLARVTALAIDYAGEESRAKRLAMGEAVARVGATWLLATASDEIAWLLNIRGADIPFNPVCLSHLLLRADGHARWFVDSRKLPNDPILGEDVETLAPEALADQLDQLAKQGERVLLDPASVHVAFAERLASGGAKPLFRDSPIPLAKARKNPTELAGARRAQARDALAVVRFLHWLETIPLDGSITEMAAARRLAELRGQLDLYQGPAFDTISAHGPNAALPHYRVTDASDRPLLGGTLYLVDSGGQYLDGTTDITRTVALGEVDAEMRQRFTCVLRGHIALARALFPPGTHGGQLDTLARQFLWEEGLDFDHGTGHGIGAYLCVHEGPQRIAKVAAGAALAAGMIVSNEPGYYKAGHYGIRIENLLIVEERRLDQPDAGDMLGFKTITLAPIDRRLIDVGALRTDERAWLDDYHARVAAELAPSLEPAIADWLRSACRPLD